jgi:hypothetical protein
MWRLYLTHPVRPGFAMPIRVASYRQLIVCYWLILAGSGSFKSQDLLRAKENPSD